MRRKELVKIFSIPSTPIHFQQEGENEKVQKSETCIFEDVGTLTKINVSVTKAKKISSWIFENVPNENYSRLTKKNKNKNRRQLFLPLMSPKITLEKEKKKVETARRKKEGEEKT